MLKRLAIIGVLTGIGQLFSLFVIKWIAGSSSVEEITQLALTDSLFQFLLNAIALGVQSAAMRDIATTQQWKGAYGAAQSARLTLSFFLIPLSLISIYNGPYLIFALAPLLALSGDYALYSLGQPVKGATLALFRILLPYGFVAAAASLQYDDLPLYFICGTALAYLASDVYIAMNLKVNLAYRPTLAGIILYIKTLRLGLVNISLYFIGLGVLLVAPYFYDDTVMTVAFVGLKFYVIVKGILRIMHQAFIKEMLNDEVCFRIDQLSMLVSSAMFGAFFIFPDSTIRILFGSQFVDNQPFFVLLAAGMMFYSFVLSMATRAMLEKKDRDYTILTAAAAALTLLLVVILSFVSDGANSIAWSILLGEFVFCTGLIIITRGSKLLVPRLIFFGKCLLVLIPFAFLSYWFGDSIVLNTISIACFLLILLFLHRKTFRILTS